MANVNQLYPSTYLKAADLNGRTATVKISRVRIEKIGNDEKPVLFFEGKEKGMVMNKTNAMTIAQAFGPDTDDWEGGEITLATAFVDFQGKQVEALRVRIPPRVPAGSQNRPATIAPNARARAEAAPATAPAENYQELDDEIPF